MIKDKDGAMNVAMRPFHLKMMDWERNNNKSISEITEIATSA